MKTISAGFVFLLISLAGKAQLNTAKIADSIVQEGKRLYRLEMASWHGTDIFLEKYNAQRSKLRGYFSYAVGKQTTCIFFSRDENPKVLVTVTFDSTFNTATAITDDRLRDFTPREKDMYTLRKLASEIINKDSFFKAYQNTNLNLIPVVENGERKLYILTGPTTDDVVLFGNDYLLRFDAQNNLTNKKQFHRNIIPVEIGPQHADNSVGAVHNHLPETGDFITATDICTLLLYEKTAKWKQHIVIGKEYVSLWDCEKDGLTILSLQAWEKMMDGNK